MVYGKGMRETDGNQRQTNDSGDSSGHSYAMYWFVIVFVKYCYEYTVELRSEGLDRKKKIRLSE